MYTDYILNGEGHGEVGSALGRTRFEPGLNRLFIDSNGVRSAVINTGQERFDKNLNAMVPVYQKVRATDLETIYNMQSPVINETALRKDEWLRVDSAVVRVARRRLRAWSDLAAANQISFDGMMKTIVEHETMSDPGFASVDMDGLSEGQADQPTYQLEGTPLPITHSGFWISRRKLMISRNEGMPISTTMAEAASRRVAETVEQTTIGTLTGMTYGVTANYSRAPTVYGYTNFPPRITKTDMTAPTGSNGSTIVDDWLALRDLLYDANHTEDVIAYTSRDWDRYLDQDYSSAKGDNTLRQRLLDIDGIADIRRLDYLTNTFTVLFVEMTSDVAEALNGMDLQTLQWETHGGAKLVFKVMAIHVPRLKADKSGQCGIAHGTTS